MAMKERYGNSISTRKKIIPKIGLANCGIVARSSRNIIMLHWKTLFLFAMKYHFSLVSYIAMNYQRPLTPITCAKDFSNH
jgi:hypothetical protein